MSFAFLPLYTGDYLRDTQHLSCSEHGIYIKLLIHCWDQKGPAPLDERKLVGITNARSGDEVEALRRVLPEFFIRMDDGWYNKRMQTEIEKAESISATRSDAGKRGYQAKAKHLLSKSQARVKLVPLPSPPHLPLQPELPQPIPSETGDVSPDPTSASRSPAVKRPAVGAETWNCYANAYAAKYGVDPVRNRKVNSQLAQLVERLGIAEAPCVAEYYLSHRHSLYVSAKHCVDLLLRDAEKLRTEWATGTQGTHTQAVMGDRTQTNFNSFAPLIAAARKKEAEEAAHANK